jgi:hypothetical protein
VRRRRADRGEQIAGTAIGTTESEKKRGMGKSLVRGQAERQREQANAVSKTTSGVRREEEERGRGRGEK